MGLGLGPLGSQVWALDKEYEHERKRRENRKIRKWALS